MSTERDTHFLGFAKLLWQELMYVHKSGWIDVSDDGFDEKDIIHYQQIITQRAYDLVKHVIENTKTGTLETAHFYFDDSVSTIPDLTEWPKPD